MAKSSTSFKPKLTHHDIDLILELKKIRQQARDMARSLTDKAIGKKFGVASGTISKIN